VFAADNSAPAVRRCVAPGVAAELAFSPRCYVAADCDFACRPKKPKAALAAPLPSASSAEHRATLSRRQKRADDLACPIGQVLGIGKVDGRHPHPFCAVSLRSDNWRDLIRPLQVTNPTMAGEEEHHVAARVLFCIRVHLVEIRPTETVVVLARVEAFPLGVDDQPELALRGDRDVWAHAKLLLPFVGANADERRPGCR